MIVIQGTYLRQKYLTHIKQSSGSQRSKRMKVSEMQITIQRGTEMAKTQDVDILDKFGAIFN